MGGATKTVCGKKKKKNIGPVFLKENTQNLGFRVSFRTL
jgi:hypothetical protein